MSPIRAGSPPTRGKIPQVPERPGGDSLKFSFKFIDLLGNEKFGLHRCADGYLQHFLERLRDLCAMDVMTFRTNKSRSLKAHRIDFGDTTERNGFSSLNDQLRAEEAWQFELTRNEHGRVHGILLLDTFYVVWIDPDHKLYD